MCYVVMKRRCRRRLKSLPKKKSRLFVHIARGQICKAPCEIACVREEPIGPDLFGPELAQRVRDLLEKLIPLYDYFTQF